MNYFKRALPVKLIPPPSPPRLNGQGGPFSSHQKRHFSGQGSTPSPPQTGLRYLIFLWMSFLIYPIPIPSNLEIATEHCIKVRSMGPLDHWIIGWLLQWSIGPLVHWSIGPLDHWSIGPLVECQMLKVKKVNLLSERTSGAPPVIFFSVQPNWETKKIVKIKPNISQIGGGQRGGSQLGKIPAISPIFLF